MLPPDQPALPVIQQQAHHPSRPVNPSFCVPPSELAFRAMVDNLAPTCLLIDAELYEAIAQCLFHPVPTQQPSLASLVFAEWASQAFRLHLPSAFQAARTPPAYVLTDTDGRPVMLRNGLYAAIAKAHALAGPGLPATSAWIGTHLARVPVALVSFYVERCGCEINFSDAFDRSAYEAVRAILDQSELPQESDTNCLKDSKHKQTLSARQKWEALAFEGSEGVAIDRALANQFLDMIRLPGNKVVAPPQLIDLLRDDLQAWGDVLVYRGMPLALRHEIYSIISLSHIHHGPSAVEKTLILVDRMWCGIEHAHVKAFVDGCKICAQEGCLDNSSSSATANPLPEHQVQHVDYQDEIQHFKKKLVNLS